MKCVVDLADDEGNTITGSGTDATLFVDNLSFRCVEKDFRQLLTSTDSGLSVKFEVGCYCLITFSNAKAMEAVDAMNVLRSSSIYGRKLRFAIFHCFVTVSYTLKQS